MQAQSRIPVWTFAIGFEEAKFNEATYAKDVADHLGTDHTELYVTAQQALDTIPRLPTVYDEPFADSSQVPTLLVSELARRDVTVSLSGDGGDELFGGYQSYQANLRFHQRHEGWPRFVRSIAGGMLRRCPPRVAESAPSLLRHGTAASRQPCRSCRMTCASPTLYLP